jgi:putative ABC transport system permease protein
MFRHYLVTIGRNLARSKLVTLMHVAGLAVGLACFVVTFVLIEQLRTSDAGFRNSGRIYAVTQELWMGSAAKPVAPARPITTLAAASYLKADFPQLRAVARAVLCCRFSSGRTPVSTGDRNGFLYNLIVDPDFLKIFDLPFLAGDRASALASSDGAIITAAAARRLFGTADVLGRRLLVSNRYWVTIKAVIGAVPQPSHMGDSEQSLVRFDILTRLVPTGPDMTDWADPICITYVLLPPRGALTPRAFRAALAGFSDRHMPRRVGRSRFDAVPVAAIRMSMLDASFASSGFSLTTSLLLLDALVLVVACLNYANLATAVALRRSREIAMRKIVGASPRQLALQSLLEAAAVGLLALALAVVLVAVAAPLISRVLPVDLELAELARPAFWMFAALLLAATALLASAYPSLVQSRLRPASALRSESGRTGPRWAFRALVAVQFAAAGFLIVLVLIGQQQNRLMAAGLPALMRNPAVVITTSLAFTGVNADTLRTELGRSPYIRSVSATDAEPWGNTCCQVLNLTRSPDPTQPQIQAAANHVGYDYFETMGLKLVAGRALSRARGDEITFSDDTFNGRRVLDVAVEQRLASRLGWANPADAVGKTIRRPALWGGVPETLRIVGVVENSAPRLIAIAGTESNLYMLEPDRAGYTVIRIDPQHIRAAVAHIESTLHSLAPRFPMEWRFMDELFGEAYATYATISMLATVLTAFAFLIALMGLAGMAVHVTTGRLREVGVRKTLGATPRQMLELLLLDFAKPVVIANLLAWPFAWLAARAYLSMFLSRAELTPLPFVASLAATVAIACIAVGSQALRAARVEPAMVLRYQ